MTKTDTKASTSKGTQAQARPGITREKLREHYSKYPCPSIPHDNLQALEIFEDRIAEFSARNERLENKEATQHVENHTKTASHMTEENLLSMRCDLELIAQHCDDIKSLIDVRNPSPSLSPISFLPGLTPVDIAVELSESCRRVGELALKLEKKVEDYQKASSDMVIGTVTSYMPNDFRSSIVRYSQERSHQKRMQKIEHLMESGGTILEKYELLSESSQKQRELLANVGNTSGPFKAIISMVGGIPPFILEFLRTSNEPHGPMEEHRETYGPLQRHFTVICNRAEMALLLALALYADEEAHLVYHNLKIEINDLLLEVERTLDKCIEVGEEFYPLLLEVTKTSPFFLPKGAHLRPGEEEITVDKYIQETVKMKEGETVIWDFTTDKDIDFGVVFRPKKGKQEVIIENGLVNSHLETVAGEYTATEPGRLVLLWDNSRSWVTKKNLKYLVQKLGPVDSVSDPDRVQKREEIIKADKKAKDKLRKKGKKGGVAKEEDCTTEELSLSEERGEFSPQ